MKRSDLLLYLFITLGGSVFAQDKLTLEQVLDIGLKNNYEIRIERNNAVIAENNNTLGNAGMLPKVDLQASTGLANNATKQEFSSGLVVDKSGVQSNNVNAGVYLTWTLFDGFKMFASHKRLAELEAQGINYSKLTIEKSIAQISNSYYNIVRQKQLIKGLEENIKISEERLKIAETKLNIGSGSKLDVLQAKVDKNAQLSNLFKQNLSLTEMKGSLNQLLSRNAEIEFDVADDIPVEFKLKYEEVKKEAEGSNREILGSELNLKVNEYLLKETKSQLFPKVNFNANYLFSRSENQAGFALLNQNLGLNLGLTATWTIFNGMNTNHQIKNSKLRLENAGLELNSIKASVQKSVFVAFRKYQDDQKLLELEEENVVLVKEAVSIALERFRIGSSNSVELKEVQKSYDEALTRLAEARYNAKVSETELMRLQGNLLR